MAKLFALILSVFLSLIALSTQAREAVPTASDPVLEQRLNHLAENLRCLVCQNQSIADSNAGLAIDLKNQAREMMTQGKSDQQIVDFMVQRYGDFVLFRPPVRVSTGLLWFGPLLLFLAGAAGLAHKLIRERKLAEEVHFDETARARAHALLAEVREVEA